MYQDESVEQAIVRLFHDEHYSMSKIRKAIHVGQVRIRYVLKKFDETGQIPNQLKKGRPSKANPDILNQITNLTIQNRVISGESISQFFLQNNIQISPSTINRYRKDILEFDFKPPKVKQFLSEENIASRILFSNSILSSEKIESNRIIFSDESRFCLCSDGYWRWYRKCDNGDDVYTKKHKFNTGVMFFGPIGKNYKSKLSVCSTSINDLEYRNILNRCEIFTELNLKRGEGNYIYMQDGAPAHKSALTKLFLKKKCNFLKFWPSNSPDLNPIEHLWGAIKRILKKYQNLSKSSFIEKVIQIWDNFPQESINRLVESFEDRLKLLITKNGQSISDDLRKGIHKFSNLEYHIQPNTEILDYDQLVESYDPSIDDCPVEFHAKRPFTIEEDILLIDLVGKLGTKWKQMEIYFDQRTSTSLRNRWVYLRK